MAFCMSASFVVPPDEESPVQWDLSVRKLGSGFEFQAVLLPGFEMNHFIASMKASSWSPHKTGRDLVDQTCLHGLLSWRSRSFNILLNRSEM